MEPRVCIWCRKTDLEVSFLKEAHTIPKSIGGEDICLSVCDNCNHYFGSPHNKLPAIETVFKETFNISRAKFLETLHEIGKNKVLTHPTSIYFDINFKRRKLVLKPTFRLKPGFQSNLCHQFKRGLFKVFLEETERQNQNGLDSKFDFIREFARYNIGDFPVLYFPRKVGAILMSTEEIKHPKIYFTPQMNSYLINYNFFEFEILGHLFSIPTSRNYLWMIDKYLNESIHLKEKRFNNPIRLEYLTQIDLLLDIMNH
jgi:HNH endonuclease